MPRSLFKTKPGIVWESMERKNLDSDENKYFNIDAACQRFIDERVYDAVCPSEIGGTP